ncbi:hypothetical protein GW813_10815 [bacterium]|nr:hypothetical protein [bacterium]PIV81274.1 MAG: hypothetical protein COW53_05245 [bacterium CG17_big_fil_post_rev_8_21_14_2_50_64_8]PJA76194.1 MAG: hypothetical protein CO151_03595 [bacterium CG_4_9_14_3_um_filter_65_15]
MFVTRFLCIAILCLMSCFVAVSSLGAPPTGELSYSQYHDLSRTAQRLNHMVQFEPLDGEAGMNFVIAERFGTVHVIKLTARGVQEVWKSKTLSGAPEEVLVVDLAGDGLDDALLCRTAGGMVYAWSLDGFALLWETLTGEYTQIPCFTTGHLDDDPQSEIVMIADGRLVQVDGSSFSKENTSIDEYSATQIRCGDVDGDGSNEVVLNTGKVLDPISGNVEWEDENFFSRIELLDIDGDGMVEILTENETGGLIKVFDVDRRSEVRFQ